MRRLATALLLAVVACTPSATSRSDVTLTEFAISSHPRLTGDVSLRVSNQGGFGHTLVVSTLDGTVITSTDVLGPGDEVGLDLDLEPGRYVFSCRIVVQTPDGEIVDHYARGMAATVEVVGP